MQIGDLPIKLVKGIFSTAGRLVSYLYHKYKMKRVYEKSRREGSIEG